MSRAGSSASSYAGSSASSSAGGSSSNGEEDDRYFSAFVDEFAARYGAWRNEENVPHTSEGYKENLEKSQTSTCARIAALHYQAELGVDLDDVCGLDSNMFECKWVDTSDYRLGFHVNFSALVKEEEVNEEDEDYGDDDSDEDEDDEEEDEDNGEDDSDEGEEDNGKPTTRIVKRFFFAELLGTNDDGPQFVTSCVMFREEMRDFSEKNCKFCPGMWHPVRGGFRGSK